MKKWKDRIFKVKFAVILLSEVFSSFLELGMSFGAWWTIAQYILSIFYVFSVVIYSGSPKWISRIKDFLFIAIGIYDIQWQFRVDQNEIPHRKRLEGFKLERNLVSNIENVWAVVAIKINTYVTARLGFVNCLSAEFAMAIYKVYEEYGAEVLEECWLQSFHEVMRTGMIIYGIFGLAITIAEEEYRLMDFLKAENLMDFIDDTRQGGQVEFNDNIQTRVAYWGALVHHLLGIFYRALVISWCFQLSWWVGLLYIVAMLFRSIVEYSFARPVYQYAPIGAPTNSYASMEVFAGMFTVRNWRISSSSLCTQIWRAIAFVFVRGLEHFGLLFILLLIFTAKFPGYDSMEFDVACNNTYFSFISDSFSIFSVSLYSQDTFLDIMLDNLVLQIVFCSYILVSVIWFGYLHFSGLNDDRFPVHAAYHVWTRKFFPASSRPPSTRDYDKYFKMMMCTVSTSMSLIEIKRLPALSAMNEQTVQRLAMAEFGNNFGIPNSVAYLREELADLLGTHPMYDAVLEFAVGVYTANLYYNEKQLTLLRCTLTKFYQNFNRAMHGMNSQKIARICSVVGISPIVKSQFTDDPIVDWMWAFK